MATQNNIIIRNSNDCKVNELEDKVNKLIGVQDRFPDSLPYLENFVKSQMTATTAQDKNGVANKMYGCYYGNVFTEQEGFYSQGKASSLGENMTPDHLFFTASSIKVFGGLVICKMLEEQYFQLNETIASYIPEFSGTGYYIEDCSGNLTPSLTGELDFSSFSGKLNTLDLGTLTIAQALGWQISHPSYSFYMVGGLLQAAFSSVFQFSNPPSKLDFSYPYSYYLGKQALEKGLLYGPVESCKRDDCLREQFYDFYHGDSNFNVGPYSDYLTTCINTIKSGKVPLQWKPGAVANDGVLNQNVPKQGYTEIGWVLVQAIMAKSLQRRGTYNNLVDYIRDKILTPLDITKNDLRFCIVEPPIDGQYLEQTFRRNASLCSGYASAGCSPSYAQNNVNGLAYVSEYKDDGFYKLFNSYKTVYKPDPLGCGLYSSVFTKQRHFIKFMKLMVTKGVYNGKRIISKSAMNFLFNNISNSGAVLQLALGNDYLSPNLLWCLGFAKFDDSNSLLSYATQSHSPYEQGLIINYPFSKNFCFGFGVSDNMWFVDLETGNFMSAITYQHGNGTRIKNVNYLGPLAGHLAAYI
jgi:hypothetical protein